ncbi:MAG: hypothetical protein DME25_18400 [Verrucomicrobia bacterium]|nr:MAG: hypothetical protein DME25_18400 [Verrucomicrobiota bacterium]
MTARRLVLLCGSALLALAQPAWGQPRMPSGSWRAYKLADGLPESACIEVTIAPQGKVLARHLATESVSELDGYGINVMPSPPTGNSRVYGSPAGQLWTVGPEGLQEFRNGGWLPHPVPEIAIAFRTGLPHLSDPIPLCPVRQGLMIVLLPDRLLQLDSEDAEHLRTKVLLSAAQTGLERFTGMTQPASREGGLWIAGTRGLIKLPGPVRSLRPDSDRQQFLIPATLAIENLAEPRDDGDGGVTALAESSESHQKLIVRFDGHEGWATKPIGVEKIRHGWRGPDQTWWAATIDSFFKWEENRPEWIESEELAAQAGRFGWRRRRDCFATRR